MPNEIHIPSGKSFDPELQRSIGIKPRTALINVIPDQLQLTGDVLADRPVKDMKLGAGTHTANDVYENLIAQAANAVNFDGCYDYKDVEYFKFLGIWLYFFNGTAANITERVYLDIGILEVSSGAIFGFEENIMPSQTVNAGSSFSTFYRLDNYAHISDSKLLQNDSYKTARCYLTFHASVADVLIEYKYMLAYEILLKKDVYAKVKGQPDI